MTIRLPKERFSDKILKILGKKRGFFIPVDSNELSEKYGNYYLEKESFRVALFRLKNAPFPNGIFPIDEIINFIK